MDSTQWRDYQGLLPDAEVVSVDLPGHGSRLGEEFTSGVALGTIERAVAGGSRGQRVVLAGHSLGGYLAMLYAARHPSALHALVVIGASAEPVGPLAGVYRWFATLIPWVGPERMARGSNAVLRRLGAPVEMLPGHEGYAALPAAWQVVYDECRAELLADVECPIFLVNGQFDQMRMHVARFAAAARDARIVTVPRASHLLPVTHAEQVAEVLREALSSPQPQDPAAP
jgi:pimeloyl-ACP methyl ester carboxylesterase